MLHNSMNDLPPVTKFSPGGIPPRPYPTVWYAMEKERPAYTYTPVYGGVPFTEHTYFFDADWKEMGYYSTVSNHFHPMDRKWGQDQMEKAKAGAHRKFYPPTMRVKHLPEDAQSHEDTFTFECYGLRSRDTNLLIVGGTSDGKYITKDSVLTIDPI